MWVTVHATKETDLKKIEEELIANNYDELPKRINKNTNFDASDIKVISEKEVLV